jgi:hypothetical protein
MGGGGHQLAGCCGQLPATNLYETIPPTPPRLPMSPAADKETDSPVRVKWEGVGGRGIG